MKKKPTKKPSIRRTKVQASIDAPATMPTTVSTDTTGSPNSYPLELVVATAAKFVTEEDCGTAAGRALTLIDACREQIDRHRAEQKPRWEFAEVIQDFTGVADRVQARHLFRRYLHDWWLHQQRLFGAEAATSQRPSLTLHEILVPEPVVAEDRTACEHAEHMLTNHERDGFSEASLTDLRETFRIWQAKRRSLSARERGRKGAAIKAANKMKNLL